MKTPIPRTSGQRLANLERITAALVDLANPEHLRRAIASVTAMVALDEISRAESAGIVTPVEAVGPQTVAVLFSEHRGSELVTASVVVYLEKLGPEAAKVFAGVRLGQEFARRDEAYAVLREAWDRVPPKRDHKPSRGRRGRV